MKNKLLISALCVLFFVQVNAQVVTSFTKRFQVTQKGGIVYLANVAVGCSSNPQTSGGSCQTAATAAAPGGTANNNDFNQVYVDIDGDASTFQSSSDSLALPNCSNITWAGLYWGAMGNAATAPTRNTIKIKVNSGAYQSITADNATLNTTGYTSYHDFKDITTIVKAAGTNARFTVANIPFVNNGTSNNWGSWTIVVVYGNQLQNMRQLTVFDGLANVSGSNIVNVPISGFLTPPTGPVNFELGTYVHDGDRGLTGDQMLFSGNGGPFINISDAENPSSNVFNSTVSKNGVSTPYRRPNLGNTMGLDADIFQPNNTTKNYLGNSNTSATLKLTTGGETYLVQEVSTAIDVYEPDLRVDKKVRDRFGVDKYMGTVAPGDTLEYTLTVYNIGSDTSIHTFVTDSIRGTAKYVPNSARITFGPNSGAKTDAGGDDQIDFNNATHTLTARVGTGANSATGGKVGNSPTGVDSTVIKFKVTAEDDCYILKCDNVVVNRAYANSTGLISGNMITTGSNPAAFDGFGCPISGTTDTYINVSLASCVYPPDTTITNICPLTETFASLYTRPGYTSFLNSSYASVTTASAPGTYYAVRTAVTGCTDTVKITVNTTNCAAPTVVNDTAITPINTPVSGNMGTNNYFPAGYTTHFNTVPSDAPNHGGLTIDAAGNYTYTPNSGFTGRDTAVVQYCGTPPIPGADVCVNDTLFIFVLPNIITHNDSATTTQDMPVSGNLNTNNSDPSGTPLTANTTPVKSPSNGVVTIGSNGSYTYTPNPGFIGRDTVVVTVCNSTTPQMCKTDTLFLFINPGYGSIGNYVWQDTNGDGLQNEPAGNGINGVKVYLYSAGANGVIGGGDDVLIDSAITANNGGNPGYYLFDSVSNGAYYVQFPTSHSGSGLTTVNQADMVDGNSDANTSTGNSEVLVINVSLSGQDVNNTTIDAGYYCNLATPAITASGSTTICSGVSVVLSSSASSGNQWYLNGVAIGGATAQTYAAAASGTYTVVQTIGTCSSPVSNAINVVVTSITGSGIATPDGTIICAGGTIQLCPSVWGFSNYQWYLNGVAIAAPQGTASCFVASVGGSYTLAAQNGAGCWSPQSSAVSVTVVAVPATPTISVGGSTVLCNGSTVTLTSSSALGNQWYLNGNSIGGATAQNYIASQAGTYTVKVTLGGSCTSAASAPVVLTNGAPVTGFTPSNANPICDSTILFTATGSNPGATYTYDFGDGTTVTGLAANVTHKYLTMGSYIVKQIITNPSGCKDSTFGNITVNSCAVSGGGLGGVETYSLGDVIGKNTYRSKTKSELTVVDYSKMHPVSTVNTTVVNGANGISLSDLIPTAISSRPDLTGYISSPLGLINYTNAIEVMSIDFTKNNSCRAVVLGMKSLGEVYSHTKPVCDRLKGAELTDIRKVQVGAYHFIRYTLQQCNGNTEYAISFVAGKNAGSNNFSIQSDWMTGNYVQADTMYNFQVWAADPATTENLINDVLRKIRAVQTITELSGTTLDKPETYILSGNRANNTLSLNIMNKTNNVDGYFEVKEKLNENSSLSSRVIPFTMQANALSSVQLPVYDTYESSLYLYVNGVQTDLIYMNDGGWNLDYDKANTTISKFEVSNDAASNQNADEFPLYRNITISAKTNGYVTAYKTVRGDCGEIKNLNAFKTLRLNAGFAGAGSIKIVLVKKGIVNWDDQYSYTLALSGNKEYAIALSDFKSTSFGTTIDASDISSVVFGIQSNGNSLFIDGSLRNVRFTKEDIAYQQSLLVKTLTVYPNPADAKFSVSFMSSNKQSLVMRITDVATGVVVYNKSIQAAIGENKINVDLTNQNIAQHFYLITLEGDDVKYETNKILLKSK